MQMIRANNVSPLKCLCHLEGQRSHECERGTHECAMPLSFFMSEHFKGLMFDCHKQLAMPKVRQSRRLAFT